MLTFFRRIRKELHNSGAAKKYLTYTVGEIALVVIGILIALQINNWNEDQKTQKQLDTLLVDLIETIEDDVRWFHRIQTANSFRANSLTYVLKLIGQSPKVWKAGEKNPMFDFEGIIPLDSNAIWNEPYPDSINYELVELTFLWSQRPLFMVPNKTAIDELKNSGIHSHIKDSDLKEMINAYYNEVEFQYSDVRNEYQNALSISWIEVLRKYGVQAFNISNMGDPIQLLKENPEITNFMKEIIDAAQTRMDLAGSNKRDALRLIKAIELELSE